MERRSAADIIRLACPYRPERPRPMPYRTKTRPYVKKRQVATNQHTIKTGNAHPLCRTQENTYLYLPKIGLCTQLLSYRLAVNLLRCKPYAITEAEDGEIFRYADGGRSHAGGSDGLHELRHLHGRLSCGRVLLTTIRARSSIRSRRKRRRCDREAAHAATRSGTAASACRAARAVRAAIRRLM